MLGLSRVSQRRVFTLLMTGLATPFGSVVATRDLGLQADVTADVLKIALIIAISSALLSFTFWSLIQTQKPSLLKGAATGFLTALVVVPLPLMAWTFKTEMRSAYFEAGESLLASLSAAILPTLESGIFMYLDMTKVSLLALFSSSCVGWCVAKFYSSDLN